MQTKPALDELFERRLTFPDFEPQERLARLVGLDDHKDRLSKILGLLVNPAGLEAWAQKHHPDAKGLLKHVLRRPPLVVLAGDVGSGKTELAETIGDAVARQEKIEITLFPLSLSSRGQGRVGEMTQLLSAAFDYTVEAAVKLKGAGGRSRGAVILLVDEADALAQSRESAQMHHEDRAGVNAFIRGIDRLANGQLPAAVIMCTNRLGALDPAVKRRAAGPVHKETIRSVKTHLGPQTSSKRTWLVDLKPADLAHIVGAGDPRNAGLMAALRERLVRFGGDGRKAFEEPVFKPRANGTPGPLIRAVKVTTIQKGGVAVRGGVADQASIWRVDVFSKAGKFYLVPVYQSDRRPTTELPSRAALAYADRSEWTLMDGSFAFRFSLFPNDYVALTTKKAVYRGYFVAMDISTASISIASHDRNAHAGKDGTWRSIGVKAGVLSFEKFHVDVLGRVFAAKQEVRHGLA